MTDNNSDNGKVVNMIEAAQKPRNKTPKNKDNSSGDGEIKDNGSGDGGGLNWSKRFGKYGILNECLNQIYISKNEVATPVKLCNFVAEIREEIEQDSGLENKTILRIEATRAGDPKSLGIVDVPASKFFSKSSSWVYEAYGTLLLVEPGNTISDHLRMAIHQYSMLNGDIPRSQIFSYSFSDK